MYVLFFHLPHHNWRPDHQTVRHDCTAGERSVRRRVRGLHHMSVQWTVRRYMVFELMDTDMSRIINSKNALTDEHYQYFVYQMLCGLKYVHTANVIHRDLVRIQHTR